MEQKFHYATVTDAINQLRAKGFNLDFNLEKNGVKVGEHEFTADEIEIVDLYRYEGTSDPGDEATVYALASKSGLKGILVTGYGASGDEAEGILSQLHYKYQNK
jgi:hypothetical protein